MEPLLYLNGNLGESLLAFGEQDSFTYAEISSWIDLDEFIERNRGSYIFGSISYDLKNEIENLASLNSALIDFPLVYFFVPEYVLEIKDQNYTYLQGKESKTSQEIHKKFLSDVKSSVNSEGIQLVPSLSKTDYLQKVNKLLNHIQHGDIYEVTFCQQFIGKAKIASPESLYGALNNKTEAPFSCFFQMGNQYLISGSPERFIKKEGQTISSQPIKGTAARSLDRETDQNLKDELKNSPKEQAENVMIVDLVRNDLSKIAQMNTVDVPELFGLYSFKTVHQMISTVTAKVREEVTFSDILQAMFPMGSMTGAPKISAMKLIDEVEDFKRGLFSGSVGYIKPNGDFDFNVIIRSILYDKGKELISCPVGSAITIQSDPEMEYEECLLKLNAMLTVLNGK